MAKIKHTKNELKAQRQALLRFERFLPMLLLKKQQLQAEIQAIDGRIAEKQAEADKLHTELESWVKLFSETTDAADVEKIISLEAVIADEGNIAGVNIPVFRDAIIRKEELDLFITPTWFDDALDFTDKLIRLRVEREILEKQCMLIADELRITTQRVNLFEKVKIPECRENIRVIKIFLGDEQTAAVVRGKIAKGRTLAYEYEDEAA